MSDNPYIPEDYKERLRIHEEAIAAVNRAIICNTPEEISDRWVNPVCPAPDESEIRAEIERIQGLEPDTAHFRDPGWLGPLIGVGLRRSEVEGLDERGVRRLISEKLERVGDALLDYWRKAQEG